MDKSDEKSGLVKKKGKREREKEGRRRMESPEAAEGRRGGDERGAR